MREELTLLRIEGAQSRLPVDWTKNAVKFKRQRKVFGNVRRHLVPRREKRYEHGAEWVNIMNYS